LFGRHPVDTATYLANMWAALVCARVSECLRHAEWFRAFACVFLDMLVRSRVLGDGFHVVLEWRMASLAQARGAPWMISGKPRDAVKKMVVALMVEGNNGGSILRRGSQHTQAVTHLHYPLTPSLLCVPWWLPWFLLFARIVRFVPLCCNHVLIVTLYTAGSLRSALGYDPPPSHLDTIHHRHACSGYTIKCPTN
jgi:hypothetical protein